MTERTIRHYLDLCRECEAVTDFEDREDEDGNKVKVCTRCEQLEEFRWERGEE